MKTKIITLFIIASSFTLKAQDSLNMSLDYNWVDTAGLYYNTHWDIRQYFNEIWGWHNDSTGEEYAVMGAADGTYFFNVTNVDSCYKIDYIEAKDNADIHRDYKSYKNYVYMVADEGNNSLQIYDMSTLPDSVTLVYDDDEFVQNSHNIYIEEGILYMVTPRTIGPDPTGFRMLDLTVDPANPTLIGDFYLPSDGSQGDHIHDLYVKNDKAYCSNGNAGFFVYDVTDKNNVSILAKIDAYTEQGYNHNSWMSEDCSTIFFTDETWGMGIKSYDITDLENITLNTIFRTDSGAIAHNVLVHGNMLYVSYYHDGVVVFDITDPANPTLVAQYDTFDEQNGYHSYQGAWGVYPYLPSGTILVSDFENGLFVLTMDSSINRVYSSEECIDTIEINDSTDFISEKMNALVITPNPADNFITLNNISKGRVEILNALGQTVLADDVKKNQILNISDLQKGVYIIRYRQNEIIVSARFVKR